MWVLLLVFLGWFSHTPSTQSEMAFSMRTSPRTAFFRTVQKHRFPWQPTSWQLVSKFSKTAVFVESCLETFVSLGYQHGYQSFGYQRKTAVSLLRGLLSSALLTSRKTAVSVVTPPWIQTKNQGQRTNQGTNQRHANLQKTNVCA